MKQFNLEEYLKTPSRKVVTRSGNKVRIICTDAKCDHPVVALVEDRFGDYESIGRYYANETTMNDLFFAQEKHEGWVNVCKSQMYRCGLIHNSEEEARRNGRKTAIATVKVEWEE